MTATPEEAKAIIRWSNRHRRMLRDKIIAVSLLLTVRRNS
jgi:hypothetical protein